MNPPACPNTRTGSSCRTSRRHPAGGARQAITRGRRGSCPARCNPAYWGMSNVVQKLAFLEFCARHAFSRSRRGCPSCGADGSEVVDRKYWFAELRRCGSCRLLYRAPTSTAAEQAAFYSSGYQEGFTTAMPDASTLQGLVDAGFRGTEKDYVGYIDVLDALGARPGQRLLDFGCSWGYGSWQLARHGFEVDAVEVSGPRAGFAREKLGVNVLSSVAPTAAYDVFFSAHVLEHVPSVASVIALAHQVLRPGGLFVAFTPNGSAAHRARSPSSWHLLWGLVHTNFLDDAFYRARFSGRPYLLASAPYRLGEFSEWRGQIAPRILDLGGDELVAVFRK